MRDLEFQNPVVGNEKPRATRRPRRKAFWAFVGFVGVWSLCYSSSSPRRSTCAACRLDRVDHAVLGFRWATFEDSECSRWYAANVEPTHAHVWASGAHCRRFGIPGIYGGFACSGGEPISGLSRSFQVRVYQRFQDPLEAKGLFVRLGRWDRETQKLMDGLSEWVDAGGPETWDEWWAKHRED